MGFYINPITGTWSKKDDPNLDESADAADEPLLDKVPNQRIVPFVEDHRNLLILTPAKSLALEAMATLQAALKRGIEMTFQIEEAELVAESLPTSDDRKALMFYESAEGGAGVLTRLATEPRSLAQVAGAALQLMHFNAPNGQWSVDGLETLEQKQQGLSICEAGCYQCLLSYFNQPDHDHINRRHPDVLNLLVALANAEVKLTTTTTSTPSGGTSPEGEDVALSAWLQALDHAGLRRPDAVNVSVNQGAATAAGQYKAARALVFLVPVVPELQTNLTDKGWQVLDFSDSVQWAARFAEFIEIFTA